MAGKNKAKVKIEKPQSGFFSRYRAAARFAGPLPAIMALP